MARQRIVHGQTIDTVTPAELARILADAVPREKEVAYHSEKGSMSLDGTGSGQGAISLGRLYGWRCKRITLSTNPAQGGVWVQIYENQIAPSDLREVCVIPTGTNGSYSDAFSNDMWVPPGSTLFVYTKAGPANGQISWNIQVELVEPGKG